MRHNGHTRAPEEIQAEIARTRSELDQTLSAIERRLTPGQLVDQGLHYLRSSGAKQYLDNLGESAKRDPIPLALVGIGLAWLMMSDRTRRREPDRHRIQEATASVKEKWSETSQRVSETAQAAREQASRAAHAAREQAERVRGGYRQLVDEQPLALGAIGLAIGAVLGGLTPRTRQEERLVGDGRSVPADEPGLGGGEPVDSAAAVHESDLVATRSAEELQPAASPQPAVPPQPFVAPDVPQTRP